MFDDTTVNSRGGCLVAGTLVHTAEGLKPIEKIRVGEWVLSQPEMTGEQAYKRVTKTFRFEDKEIWEVCYLTPDDASGTIRATAEHPFWVHDIGWQGVEYLESFQLLLLHDGDPCVVGYVKRLNELAPVFNFEVEDFLTYYVGEWGVWVHSAD